MGPKLRVTITLMVIVGLLLAAYPFQQMARKTRVTEAIHEGELVQVSQLGAATILLLGGFRGLAVDALWLQSLALHEQRKYHEERAILDLISRLQPNYASVWVFQAWNIAFNIAVQYEDPEEQFKWVWEGTQFLLKGQQTLPENADVAFYLGILYSYKYPQDPRLQELLQEREELNNWQEAARWFDRSRTLIREEKSFLSEFHPRLADAGVFHCYLRRYQQALEQGEVGPDGFDPDTLARAEPWRLKCIEEAQGLNRRWPDDVAFVTFPARVALAPVDALVFHAREVLLSAVVRGPVDLQAESRADHLLLLARRKLDRVRTDYPADIDRAPLLHRVRQISLAAPEVYLQSAAPVIVGQAQPPRERVLLAREWLDRARVLLGNVTISGPEVEDMRRFAAALLERTDEILKAPVEPVGAVPESNG